MAGLTGFSTRQSSLDMRRCRGRHATTCFFMSEEPFDEQNAAYDAKADFTSLQVAATCMRPATCRHQRFPHLHDRGAIPILRGRWMWHVERTIRSDSASNTGHVSETWRRCPTINPDDTAKNSL